MLDVVPTQSETGVLASRKIQFYATNVWTRVCSVRWSLLGNTVATGWKIFLKRSVLVLGIVGVLVALVVQAVNWRSVIIETISVPKQLQENGFTAEVAAQRLRDALNELMTKNKTTSMGNPDIRLHAEVPDVVVPGVGLSMEAIVATIRKVFHSDDRQVVSGDLTMTGTGTGAGPGTYKVWLRLRLNGKAFYDSEGTSLDGMDQLFQSAAHEIIWKTAPYLIASATYFSNVPNPNKALQEAEQIIAQRQPTDENVSRAYNLEALIYREQKNYKLAKQAVEKALEHAPKTFVARAHNTKGLILFDEERYNRENGATKNDQQYNLARSEFETATHYDGNYGLAYLGLGLVLQGLGDDGAALTEYQAAINHASNAENKAIAVQYCAVVLQKLGRGDEATAQCGAAVKVAPGQAVAASNPELTEGSQGRPDDAAASSPDKADIIGIERPVAFSASPKQPTELSGSLPGSVTVPIGSEASTPPYVPGSD